MEEHGWNERQVDSWLYGNKLLIVWDVIKNKIPELHKQIIEVLEKHKNYR